MKRQDTLKMAIASEPDDLSQLLSLDEDSVRDALRGRFEKEKIYTHINSLLVAVNPYKLLPIYGDDALEAYAQYGKASPGPHVFGVAASAYRGLLDARSQSIIISGESTRGGVDAASGCAGRRKSGRGARRLHISFRAQSWAPVQN